MGRSDHVNIESIKKHVREQALVIAKALDLQQGIVHLTGYFGRDFPDELETEINDLKKRLAE